MNFALLFPVLSDLLKRLIPDPAAQAAAQMQLLQMNATGELARLASETDLAKGQIAVNQVEAASTRLFVAGWRPFIGWVCGGALAWDTISRPMITLGWVMAGNVAPQLPPLATEQIYGLLFGLLGLGAMRTVEKIKGAA